MQNNTLISGLKFTSIFGMPFNFVKIDADRNSDMHICNMVTKLCNNYKEDCIPKYIVTVNMDFVHKSFSFLPNVQNYNEQKHLLEIICSSDLVVADGMPLVWLSSFMGNALPERVTGADIVPALAGMSSEIHEKNIRTEKQEAKDEVRLYFLGGGEGVAQRAVENLKKDYPYINVVGVASPEIAMPESHDKDFADKSISEAEMEIIKNINESKPDILFLALGNPKQEFWFYKYQYILKVGVGIGVGGALDFLAGNTARAPLWMQRAGVEWLWRLQQEPLRLAGRYLIGAVKFFTLGVPMLTGQLLCWIYSRCVCCTQSSALYEPVVFSESPCIPPFSSMVLSNSNKKEIENEFIITHLHKKTFYTLITPQIIDAKYFKNILDQLEQINKEFCERNDMWHLCFDMRNTVYADTTSIAIIIKLFYWLKKIHEHSKWINNYHSNNVSQPLEIQNLRWSMRILLKTSGAYASLHKAIVY